ncbi:hypothetical protein EZE20_03430 [Arundinibacter roseus]|uniref:RHS repeat-associated core domain-containing protein n=1 Tax=Arundinibacter roseus TaxID=2070510 RepID=A0A4R4KIG8_9BACT|nr:hypothetical protein EZE20_03430 [Arundinibacter roseus]
MDYGARQYDATLGRWMSGDPLAEQAPDWTPYRYGFNNPLKYTERACSNMSTPTAMALTALRTPPLRLRPELLIRLKQQRAMGVKILEPMAPEEMEEAISSQATPTVI